MAQYNVFKTFRKENTKLTTGIKKQYLHACKDICLLAYCLNAFNSISVIQRRFLFFWLYYQCWYWYISHRMLPFPHICHYLRICSMQHFKAVKIWNCYFCNTASASSNVWTFVVYNDCYRLTSQMYLLLVRCMLLDRVKGL